MDRRRRGRAVWTVGGLMVCFIAGIVAWRWSIPTADRPTLGAASAKAPKGHLATIPMCGSYSSGFVATLGRLAPGHSMAELAADGIAAAKAYVGTSDDELVLHPSHPDAPFDLSGITALASSAVLRPQTSDSTLRSCEYHLADNPAASAVANVSIAAMIQDGNVAQPDTTTGNTVEMLTDDPFNSGQLLFIFVLPSPSKAPVPGEANVSRRSVVAFVDRTTHTVTGTAITNLYATGS